MNDPQVLFSFFRVLLIDRYLKVPERLGHRRAELVGCIHKIRLEVHRLVFFGCIMENDDSSFHLSAHPNERCRAVINRNLASVFFHKERTIFHAGRRLHNDCIFDKSDVFFAVALTDEFYDCAKRLTKRLLLAPSGDSARRFVPQGDAPITID